MFTKEEEVGGYFTLKQRFLKDLNKEIQTNSYKERSHHLRKILKKKIEKEELF